MTKKKITKNQSVEKVLSIIEIMALKSEEMRLQDISNEADLPMSTTLRLLFTLQEKKYVHQNPDNKKYYLSLKLFYLGNLISSNIELRDIAKPYLKDLSLQLNRSVNLAIEQDNEAFILDVVGGSEEPTEITTQVGRKIPLYCTSLGKSILSNYSNEMLLEYLDNTGLKKYTSLTIVNKDEIIEEIHNCKIQGYSIDRGEFREGIMGISAPIYSNNGFCSGSISVADLSTKLYTESMSNIVKLVIKTARLISDMI